MLCICLFWLCSVVLNVCRRLVFFVLGEGRMCCFGGVVRVFV